MTYQYEAEPKFIRVKATGIVTTKEMLEYVSSVIEDAKIEKNFIEIVDMQHVSDLIVTYSELKPFQRMWEKYVEKGCRAVVCYAPTDLSYGTVRMIKSIILAKWKTATGLFFVVRSEDELANKIKEILA